MLTVRPQITFNPHNVEHVLSIKRSLDKGVLDPQFRFHLEEGYTNVMTMATDKMARMWMEQVEFNNRATKIAGDVVADMVREEGTVVSFVRTPKAPLESTSRS